MHNSQLVVILTCDEGFDKYLKSTLGLSQVISLSMNNFFAVSQIDCIEGCKTFREL